MSPELFYTTDEIAYKLRCSVAFVRKEIREGKFPKTYVWKRQHFIPQKSYEQYLENRLVRHHG